MAYSLAHSSLAQQCLFFFHGALRMQVIGYQALLGCVSCTQLSIWCSEGLLQAGSGFFPVLYGNDLYSNPIPQLVPGNFLCYILQGLQSSCSNVILVSWATP